MFQRRGYKRIPKNLPAFFAFGHGFIVADRNFIPERTVAENGPCLISSLNQKLPPLRGNPQDAIDEAIEVGIIEQCDPISSADGA